MPVEVRLWRVDRGVERVHFAAMPNEEKLEDILSADVSIVNPGLLLIGRQVHTSLGKFIDLLAIDAEGNLVVMELKRGRTPRDVVAQALDYGSWVRTLESQDIAGIFDAFIERYHPEREALSLDEAFREKFGVDALPESLNEDHELIVMAGELDPSTERIVNYLSDEYGVAINAVFFRFYEDEGAQYLSRVWLIDPAEVESRTIETRTKRSWNGEFYVSFGERENRKWADARTFGYIAAGHGEWYSRTLSMLEPGDRIWVNAVPRYGYVGVGRVMEAVKPITEFRVQDESGELRAIYDVASVPPREELETTPEDEYEYFVRVDWIETVSLSDVISETGFFGNQNTVARPKTEKWDHTVERLKKRFRVE